VKPWHNWRLPNGLREETGLGLFGSATKIGMTENQKAPSQMSLWTKERLDQLIADGVEESLSLEYKRAGALARNDSNKIEMTKDISSFANSAGGIVIYGIAESAESSRKHLPERLDPILRSEASKEWLDQIIQSIQPRIHGVAINSVTISEQGNTVCYVVEIPQSHTVHMARDGRYHKRSNGTTVRMDDYEVRDVMNRRKHPIVKASILINKYSKRAQNEGVIIVKVQNAGCVLARHVMVELGVPFNLNGTIRVAGSTWMNDGDGDYMLMRLTRAEFDGPLFPGSYLRFKQPIKVGERVVRIDGSPVESRKYFSTSVFADESPPLHAKLDVSAVLEGWVSLEPCKEVPESI